MKDNFMECYIYIFILFQFLCCFCIRIRKYWYGKSYNMALCKSQLYILNTRSLVGKNILDIDIFPVTFFE